MRRHGALQQAITDGAVTMAPIEMKVLAEGGTTAVADAYWLMVPDAVYNAEDAIGIWRPPASGPLAPEPTD